MEKFLIISRRNENNPLALETVLKLNSRNGDVIYVLYLNVENTKQIRPACKWLNERIKGGKIKVDNTAKQMVARLTTLTSKGWCTFQCKKKLAELVARNLQLKQLDAQDCMLVYEAA